MYSRITRYAISLPFPYHCISKSFFVETIIDKLLFYMRPYGEMRGKFNEEKRKDKSLFKKNDEIN